VRVASPNLTDVEGAKVTQLSKAQKIQHLGAEISIENEVDQNLMVLSIPINPILIPTHLFQAVEVTFDSINRGLKSITNKKSKISLDVHQGFYWYHSWGEQDSFVPQQRSGAYIFR
jgi:uncharacterized protein YcfL